MKVETFVFKFKKKEYVEFNFGKIIIKDSKLNFEFLFDEVYENIFVGAYPNSREDINSLLDKDIRAVFSLQTKEDI